MRGHAYYITTLGEHNQHISTMHASHWIPVAAGATPVDTTPIIVQVEAEEWCHLNLEANPKYRMLPHMLSGQNVPATAATALAGYGITTADTIYSAALKLAAVHPGLRPQRF